MVNPGAFQGTRKQFLTAQKALYSEAVTGNHVADTVADIQRRYFKRYPISLPHTEEPTAEWLANVDDNSPDEDLLPPDKTALDNEAFKVAQTAYSEQVKLLKFRKEQIARRLSYEHAKDKNPTKRIAVGSDDPMAVLMAKLAGIPVKKPRVRTGYNLWGQNNRQFVDPIYEQRVRDGNVPAKKRAALRMQVYKECFDELDEEERREYENRAAEEHLAAVNKIDEALNAPPSQAPEDRQQVLKNLPTFVQPILDIIAGYSGWKATLLVGGPEPADRGRLNMMSFHAGETAGNIKMNFGRSERRAYKNFVMPVFGTFLKKCYTVDDCRAAALSDSSSMSLAEVLQLEGGESFSVDSVEDCVSYIKVAHPQGLDLDFAAPDAASSSSTYEVPTKVGPPIHSQKRRTTPLPNALPMPHSPSPLTEQAASSLPFDEETHPPSHGQSAALLSAPPLAPSITPPLLPSRAPSPAPSRAPSPAPSLAPSLPPSRAPSPAPPLAPSLSPSRAPSPGPPPPLPRFSPTSTPCPANASAFQPSAQPQETGMQLRPSPTAQVRIPPAVLFSPPALQPAAQGPAFSAASSSPSQAADGDQGLPLLEPPAFQVTRRIPALGGAVGGAPRSVSPHAEEVERSPKRLCSKTRNPSPPRKRLRSSKEDSLPRRNLRSSREDSPPRKRLRSSKENSPPRRSLRSSKEQDTALKRPQTAVRGRQLISLTAAPAQSSFATMASSSGLQRSPPLTSNNLSGCPDWFLNSYQMFISEDFGLSWAELVRAWAHFEKEAKYQEIDKLGTAGRPTCISAWIARARAQGFRPDLGSLPAFEKDFNTWWAGLQPEWRRTGSNGALEKQHGDLEDVRRPGKNGIQSVLAALFFWATYGKKAGGVGWETAWTQAVNDVCWVIQGLRSN